jgi:putative nucleotidyltransferase with HDIG domain
VCVPRESGDVVAEIPAIKELDSESLRAAVVATWTAAMDGSPYASLADVPQSPLPLMIPRPLLLHVNEVNDLALHFLDLAVARFGLPVDRDAALATAILHDVDKPLIYRRGDGPGLDYAPGTQLKDHGAIGAALAAEHGVPAPIVEMIRVHSPFASDGLPGTPEGTIVHYADFVANDLACLQFGADPIHASFDLTPRPGANH